MAHPPLGHPLALLAMPRHPAHRWLWLARVLGPGLGLTLAAGAAIWLAEQAAMACAACPWPSPVAGLVVVLAASLLGLALGLVAARGRWPGRLATGLALLLAVALPLIPALLVVTAEPLLLAPAIVLSLLAATLVGGPARLATQALTAADSQRRQWWQTSLRAARLTRRTLGLGTYRQLCATGHIRVLSALHPGRVYLVPRRTSPSGARVLVEEAGRVVGGLCLRPREPLPDPEEVVAHVLLLRGDERAYLAAANFFPYDTVLTPQAIARRP